MLKKYRKSLSGRLSLRIVHVTALLYLLAFACLTVFSYIAINKYATDSAEMTLRLSINDLEKTLIAVESAVKNTGWVVKDNADTPEMMFSLTEELVRNNPDIVGSAVAFRPDYFKRRGHWFMAYSSINEQTGKISSSQTGNDKYDYFEMDWYTRSIEKMSGVWSDPYFDEGGGNRIMTTYSLPLTDKNGEVFAVITADISASTITRKLASIKPYENSYMMLTAVDGTFISHPDTEEILNGNLFDKVEELEITDGSTLVENITEGKLGYQEIELEGYESFCVYGPLSNGWVAALVCPYKDVFARTHRITIWLLVIALLVLMMLYFIVRRVIRKETLQITEFTYSAEAMGKGIFNAILPGVRTEDELKKLHDSLEYMQKSIRSYIGELRSTTASNERFESELNIASSIQMAMLPVNFEHNDTIDFYASVTPAKEVGGDLYDFYQKDGVFWFIVGDVSGKGVPAALYMAITRSAFRFISGMGLSPAQVVGKLNDALCDGNTHGMFVTLFVGRIELDSAKFTYCNAGHNPIIVKNPDKDAYYLKAKPNLTAGLISGFQYEEEEMVLEKDSRLLIYTDGVTEAENRSKQQFGEGRLLEFVSKIKPYKTARQINAELIDEVSKFTDGAIQNDDITIFSLHMNRFTKRRFDPIKDKSADIIEYLMSSPDIPEDAALQFKIRLAVEEAVENVVRYAYEGGIGWMEVGTSLDNGVTLTIELRDAGTPFNPLGRKDPDINASAEEREIGGLGIFLCKNLMDNIEYKYEDGCNVLIMQKKVE